MNLKNKVICVIGAAGQIGTELTIELRKRYGNKNVVAVGRKTKPVKEIEENFYFLDILKKNEFKSFLIKHKVNVLINMAAILSGNGEKNPNLCWNVNMNGLLNCLELAKELKLDQVFIPSSIAAFGDSTPKKAPQDTILQPTSMYGITKVTGELLLNYYHKKFNVDCRGIRYPGIISSVTLPGGGSTDYSVEIFYSAIKYKKYKCFVRKDTALPLMYMPDCIKSTIDLMNADSDQLSHRGDYNVTSLSFTVEELANKIKKHIPEFQITYEPDFRQKIVDSWPEEMDDSLARKEWNWKPSFSLDLMVEDMLKKLKKRLEKGTLNYVNPDFEK